MGPPNFSRSRSPAATASQPRRRAPSSRGGGSAPGGEGTLGPRPARGPGQTPLPSLPLPLSTAAKSNAAAAAATTAAQLGARRSRMLSSALTPPLWAPRAATSLHIPGPAPPRGHAPSPGVKPHPLPVTCRGTQRASRCLVRGGRGRRSKRLAVTSARCGAPCGRPEVESRCALVPRGKPCARSDPRPAAPPEEALKRSLSGRNPPPDLRLVPDPAQPAWGAGEASSGNPGLQGGQELFPTERSLCCLVFCWPHRRFETWISVTLG